MQIKKKPRLPSTGASSSAHHKVVTHLRDQSPRRSHTLVNLAAAPGDEALGQTRRRMSGFTAAETRPYCADPSQGL
jgi:hypothetical protein